MSKRHLCSSLSIILYGPRNSIFPYDSCVSQKTYESCAPATDQQSSLHPRCLAALLPVPSSCFMPQLDHGTGSRWGWWSRVVLIVWECHDLMMCDVMSSQGWFNKKKSHRFLRSQSFQGADRALVVDVQNERIRLQNLTRMQEAAEAGQEAGAGARHNVSLSSSDTDPRSRLSPAGPGKLTVRAMPDPDSSFNTDRLESLQSAEHIRSVFSI